MVPVSLIEFAAQWGHIKGCDPGLVEGNEKMYTNANTGLGQMIEQIKPNLEMLGFNMFLCEHIMYI